MENNCLNSVLNTQNDMLGALKTFNDIASVMQVCSTLDKLAAPIAPAIAELDRVSKDLAGRSLLKQTETSKIVSDIKATAEPAFAVRIRDLHAIANGHGALNAMRHAFELSQRYHQFVEMIANAKLFKALNTVASIQRRSSYSRSFARERRSPSRSQFTTSRTSGGGGSGGDSDPPDPPDRSRSHSNSLSRARKMELGIWLVSLRSYPYDDEPP